MKSWRCSVRSLEETARLGEKLANCVKPGNVISLVGDLGAGKTTFVRSLAIALGVPPEDVTSPTFVLIHEYAGRLPLFHFDTYRLKDVDELLDLGAEEYFYGDGVCLIEWGDRVREILPEDYLRIEIAVVSPEAREFRFESSGERSDAVLDELQRMVDAG